MFIMESKSRAARKGSFLIFVALLVLLKSIGGILTMHFYVPPRQREKAGWRFTVVRTFFQGRSGYCP
jgi:hypothetical protein